jgi:uncharacterized protein YeaC (DUF1315 family)
MKKVVIFLFFICNYSFSQVYVGGQLLISSKSSLNDNLVVHPQHFKTIEFGINMLYSSGNKILFKTELLQNSDRFSENGINYLNEFLQLNLLTSLMSKEISTTQNHNLLFGLYFKGLYKYGFALSNEIKYTSQNFPINENMFFGIISQYSISLKKNKWLNSISLTSNFNLTSLQKMMFNEMKTRNNAIQVGVNFNINTSIKK